MTSRREFLEATALAALPLGAHAIPADPASSLTAGPQLVLLEDPGYEARLFGAHLATRGAQVHQVPTRDLAPMMFGLIEPLWSHERAPVAGLTSLSTLFCLEQFAWQHGLRVVFHAEHLLRRDGSVRHELLRGRVAARAGAAERAPDAWTQRFADSVASALSRSGRRSGPSVAGLEPSVPPASRLLASWLIA